MTTNALTLHDGNNNSFAIITAEEGESALKEILELGVKSHELPLFKVPSGGGTTWEGELSEGAVSSKSLEVVIAWAKAGQRSFHSVSFDEAEEGSAPDCSSEDGRTGYGAIMLDGERAIRTCETCANNQWNSGKKKGKACTERIDLFCFTPEEILPIIVRVPPTSLGNFRNYAAIKLLSKLRKPSGVITRLTLRKESGSPAYSVIEFEFVRELEPENAAKVKGLASSMQAKYFGRTAEQLAALDSEAADPPRTVEADDWTDSEK